MVSWEYLVVFVLAILFTVALYIYIMKYNKIDFSVVIPTTNNINDVQCSSDYVSKLYVLIWRILSLIFAMITIISLFVYTKTALGFAFYTIWNYIIFIIYYACSSILSYKEYKRSNGNIIDDGMNRLRKFIWILFLIECSNALLICLVVWFLLYPIADSSDRRIILHFSSLSMHNINFICLLIDLMITRIPIPFYGGIYALLFVSVYGVFAIIFYNTYGIWTYPFLDYSIPFNAVMLLGVFLFHYICYLFIKLCAYLRDNYCCKTKESTKDKMNANINANNTNDVEIPSKNSDNDNKNSANTGEFTE